MAINKSTRFRWVRPTCEGLNPEVRVWQPMMYREYPRYMADGIEREYVNFYHVGIPVDENHVGDCELGDWIERPT